MGLAFLIVTATFELHEKRVTLRLWHNMLKLKTHLFADSWPFSQFSFLVPSSTLVGPIPGWGGVNEQLFSSQAKISNLENVEIPVD